AVEGVVGQTVVEHRGAPGAGEPGRARRDDRGVPDAVPRLRRTWTAAGAGGPSAVPAGSGGGDRPAYGVRTSCGDDRRLAGGIPARVPRDVSRRDRKSTRLNSS